MTPDHHVQDIEYLFNSAMSHIAYMLHHIKCFDCGFDPGFLSYIMSLSSDKLFHILDL